MGTRVDGAGYLIDHTGKRLTEHNSPEEAAKRLAKIIDAWEKNNKGDKDGPPPGTPMFVVENGDCIWRIADGAGANEATSSWDKNLHFKDPNLINPGDIVFTDRVTQLDADGQGRDNVDLFRDQMAGWTPQNPQEMAQYTNVANSYIASTGYQPELVGAIVAPGSDKVWTDANKAGRQQLLTSYFSHIKKEDRPFAATMIAGAPDADPLLLGDVKTALKNSDGAPMPGTTDSPRNGPRVTKYQTVGDIDNSGVFHQEFEQHVTDLGNGYFYRGNGANQPIPADIDMGQYASYSTFSMRAHEEWTVEKEMTDYVKSAPPEIGKNLVLSLLADPDMTSEGRKVAVSGYLKAFEPGAAREKAKNDLLSEVKDPKIKADIEAGMKFSQRYIAGS